MIKTSKDDHDRCIPFWRKDEPGAPVYLMRPGDVIERGIVEAELTSRGAGRVFAFSLVEAFRTGIETMLPDDPEGAQLIALAEQEAGLQPGETMPADEIALLAGAREQLKLHWPPYRDLVAQQALRLELAPILAFRRFCVGWENVAAKFARGLDGQVRMDAVAAIDPMEMIAAGNRAFNLLYAGDQAGNSERPSTSEDGPPSSNSGASLKAAGRSKARSGRKTPA